MAILSHFTLCEFTPHTARGEQMDQPTKEEQCPPRKRIAAFSLVELMAVIAIILILTSLLGPAINSMTSTAGRKGAVNTLMNTLEQARAAALETGANVYVILWQREFPDQDSLIVVRDPVEWNANEQGKDFIPLTKWIQLPKGVLLYSGKGKSIFGLGVPKSLPSGALSQLKTGGSTPSEGHVAVLQFGPSGTVQHPSGKLYNFPIIVSEGVRGTGGTEAILADKKQKNGGFEIIRLRRFTGRASLEVSTL
jgi:type II secretory pathway pseudopilin PulG